MGQQKGIRLLREMTSVGVLVVVLLVEQRHSVVQALRFQPEGHETWPEWDSAESALTEKANNLEGYDGFDFDESDYSDTPSFAESKSGKAEESSYDAVVKAAATIAKLDPDQTLGRWHAEKEQGTKAADFLDKILGTKDVQVTDQEMGRIKTFAEQQRLDPEQAASIWKKFKKEGLPMETFIGEMKGATRGLPKAEGGGASVAKREGDKEEKTWGQTIGEAVDYAGDKIAEGWSSLVSRFTDQRSDEAASEAAAKTALERGDLRGAVREHSHDDDERTSKTAADETEKAAQKEARRLVKHDTKVHEGVSTKVECHCKKVGPHAHHHAESK